MDQAFTDLCDEYMNAIEFITLPAPKTAAITVISAQNALGLRTI
nr:hypothetical protein [Acetobacter persici]